MMLLFYVLVAQCYLFLHLLYYYNSHNMSYVWLSF
jgi:hypothetical protein